MGLIQHLTHKKKSIEIHILDFNMDIYGEDLKVSVVKKIRKEKKFSSVEELKKILQLDENKVRQLLKIKNIIEPLKSFFTDNKILFISQFLTLNFSKSCLFPIPLKYTVAFLFPPSPSIFIIFPVPNFEFLTTCPL